MPEISLVPIRKYQALWGYHHYYDNLPITDLETQVSLVNSATDLNTNSIEQAIGTSGNLANRLNTSILPNGDLKTSAVDEALHSIEEHTDSDDYVRMTSDERAKLTLIESNATNLTITLDTEAATWPDVSVDFTLVDSDSITWRLDSGNVYADTSFALSLITTNHFDITPVLVSGVNYKTTSIDTAYKSGSLRVFVNGLRLTKSPTTIGGYYYSETLPSAGTFALNTTLGSNVLRIDFDQPLS